MCPIAPNGQFFAVLLAQFGHLMIASRINATEPTSLPCGNTDFDHAAPAHPYACVDVQRLDAAFHRAERPRGYRPHPRCKFISVLCELDRRVLGDVREQSFRRVAASEGSPLRG
jgi:hypothetical protein